MKVSEAVERMSKLYLSKIVDSFAKDVLKQDEDKLRDFISKNVKDLSDTDRIVKILKTNNDIYNRQILERYLLESLLNQPEYSAEESTLVREIQDIEESIIKESKSEDCFRFSDKESIVILRSVLEVAIDDLALSPDELKLIRHLREKLLLSRKDQFLLLAQLNHYPKEANKIHAASDVSSALNSLQKIGTVFYCNQHEDGARYVIPEEIVPGVKEAIGFQLSDEAYSLLLENLSANQLGDILAAHNVKKSGIKEELIQRVIKAELLPTEALDVLSNQELYELLKSLPGANVSGTKNDKIERIIDYFSNLVVKPGPKGKDKREAYYNYLIELAKRDRKNLLSNKIISKDKEMERAFEEGTRYLFEEKFNIELMKLAGTDNPDGCIQFNSDELFMWDNKSKEDIYTFPNSHFTQFKRYIRDAEKRVTCFLVIVPSIEDDAEKNAYKLKVESKADTDIALISAEDLKWTAENWNSYSSKSKFNLEVFNITGILDRKTLTDRMDLLLS